MNSLKKGVTLLELIVVLMIISILTTIATGVYTQELQRAKIAKTRAEIRSLELAINRYQIDTGQFPPSGTGINLAPNPLQNTVSPYAGCGYMQVALRSSINGNQLAPLSSRWIGPYFDFDENRLGLIGNLPITASTSPAEIQFLDAWGNPFYYIQSADYVNLEGTFLPVTSPYAAVETYYNVSTFQLISFGPNSITDTTGNAVGTEPDDLTNWEASGV